MELEASKEFCLLYLGLTDQKPLLFELTDQTCTLVSSPSLAPDLQMWLHILRSWKDGVCKWSRSGPEIPFFHDASKAGDIGGFGFYLGALPPDCTLALPHALTHGNGFAGSFSPGLLAQHDIQWAELFAIAFGLALYGPYLRDRCVLLWSDNLADVTILNKQSTRSPELLLLLRAIYSTAAHYRIRLRAKHIDGDKNHLADLLSRPKEHKHSARAPHVGCLVTQGLTLSHTHIHYISSAAWNAPKSAALPATATLEQCLA